MSNYGLRNDGITQKGEGYFGSLNRYDVPGSHSSELTVGVTGRELYGEGHTYDEIIDVPSFVPTLTQEELDYLLSGGQITPQIRQKALEFARRRLQEGKSIFAEPNEKQDTNYYPNSETPYTKPEQATPVPVSFIEQLRKGYK